jgi:beta-barrel assembly-enhancing protease
MKKNRNKKPGSFAFITAAIALILISSASQLLAMSIDEENKLGKEFLTEVNKEVPVIDDPFVNDYLKDLGDYIGQYQDKKPFTLNFYIAKDSQLNAFAGPAGHVFVYSGLINAMDEVDELASVISHEIGHVSVRHLSSQTEKSKLVGLGTMAGVLAGALIGGDVADALIVGSVAAGNQVMLSYSRDDEREADQLGFKQAYRAGFKPEAFISALARLQQGQWGQNQTPAYLLTHPVDSERMSNLQTMSRQFTDPAPTEETERFRKIYPLFRTIVKAQSTEPKVAVRYFNSELEKEPDSSLAHFGLGMSLQNSGQYVSAIGQYNIALEGVSEKACVLRYLGEVYQLNGQNRDAISTFERVLKIKGKDKSALSMLAMSYQELEEYSKAVEIYERLTLLEPVKDDVFYNLGLCLGRQNNLALAHFNFGRYFKRTGDMETANFHFKKAGELAGADNALQEKIKKEMEEIKKDNKPMKPPAQ